jgi:hypothetical protein
MIVEILANLSIALAWLFTPPALASDDYSRQPHQQ